MLGPEQSPEVVVRTRILAVIDYLNRIQQNSNLELLGQPLQCAKSTGHPSRARPQMRCIRSQAGLLLRLS